MTSSSSSAWRRLPSTRTKSGGPRPPAVAVLRFVAGGAAAIGFAWLVYAAVSPLPTEPASTPPTLAEWRPLAPHGASLDQRQRVVAQLSTDNPFSFGRKPWAGSAQAAAPDVAQTNTNQSAASIQPVNSPAMPIAVAQAPEDIRKALESIELKQIHTNRNGELIARIGFVHSPTRNMTRAVVAGEQFKDEPAGNEWKVLEIDAKNNRVVLQHKDRAISIPLFPSGVVAEPSASGEIVPTVAAKPDPVVIERSREQVVKDLRDANIPERDIVELLKLMEERQARTKPEGAPVEPAATPATATTTTVEAPVQPIAPPTASSGKGPPPGLEGVLRMMAQQQKEIEKTAPLKKEPEKKADAPAPESPKP